MSSIPTHRRMNEQINTFPVASHKQQWWYSKHEIIMYVQFYEKPHGGFKATNNFCAQIQNKISSLGLCTFTIKFAHDLVKVIMVISHSG